MVLRHGKDCGFVFFLPVGDQAAFGFAPEHHEGRRSHRMNEVAGLFGEQRDVAFIGRHRGLELLGGPAAEIKEQRNEPDAGGEQADHLFGHAGAHRRIDHADDSAPTGKRHLIPRLVSSRRRLLADRGR